MIVHDRLPGGYIENILLFKGDNRIGNGKKSSGLRTKVPNQIYENESLKI